MTPDERADLGQRLLASLDLIPAGYGPGGTETEFLLEADSDEALLFGLEQIVDDLAWDLASVIKLDRSEGSGRLTSAIAKRRRGRPKGTRTHTRATIVDVFRTLSVNYGRAPTQRELCDNLNPRIEPRALQDALDAYGLPWPIE